MINVGIIGCGFVGGALKDWLEHNNPECKLFISDPAKGYNDSMADIDIAFLQIHVPTEDDGTQDLTLMKQLISALLMFQYSSVLLSFQAPATCFQRKQVIVYTICQSSLRSAPTSRISRSRQWSSPGHRNF